MQKLIFALSAIIAISCTTMTTPPSSPQIQTQNGTIEGYKDSSKNLNVFLGIPYAKPPVGDLRWVAPQPLDNWTGIIETKKFANRAIQHNVWGDMIYRSDTMSEDCLYLNVWAPADKSEELLPVLFYIHGGGYIAGTGNEPRYDGASMAQKGMVVVTVNYRLNIFGFFAHPELSAEADYKASGNYGLLDQAAALKWVSENITAFRGDPNRICIAGESAGSISVSSHMASPLSKHLIAQAIGESGAAINPTLFPKPLKDVEQDGVDFIKKTGYSNLSDIRSIPANELYELYTKINKTRFSTAIDGYFFTHTPTKIFESGEQAQVPLLAGWNSAEIPAAAIMQGKPLEKDHFIDIVNYKFGEFAPEILMAYPHNTPDELLQSATDLASDQFINFSTWKWIDLHSKNSSKPIYRYLFSHIRTQNEYQLANNWAKPYGAPHASEIEYCLGNLYLIDNTKWTKDDLKTEQAMQNYFASFIITGNPNSETAPNWPELNATENKIQIMDISAAPKVMEVNDNRFEALNKFFN